MQALRDRNRAVVPDHIGCGLSDKPQRYAYTLAQHAANVGRLLDELERWNSKFNLTAIRDRGDMLTLHLLDRPFVYTLVLSVVVGPPVGLLAGWVGDRFDRG